MTEPEQARTRVVFFFDVDNTLLDNDRVAADLKDYLAREVWGERLTTVFPRSVRRREIFIIYVVLEKERFDDLRDIMKILDSFEVISRK